MALVEKAAADLDHAESERMAKKLAKGKFRLDDLSAQLGQMQKMGGMEGSMGLLPSASRRSRPRSPRPISTTRCCSVSAPSSAR